MIKLHDYLQIGLVNDESGNSLFTSKSQREWFTHLNERLAIANARFLDLSQEDRQALHSLYSKYLLTEELKAWYGAPEKGELFQGTSVTSLVIPHKVSTPMELKCVTDLEEEIATGYLEAHHRHENVVRRSILESTEAWIQSGLYFGVVLPSKVISQAFGLSISESDLICEVDGFKIDPHEITSYPQETRRKYFSLVKSRVSCLDGLQMTQSEFEECLILADISKPKIEKYRDQLLLAPPKCNEICSLLSKRVVDLIRKKSKGVVNPESLAVVIYDTDTPYACYQNQGYVGHPMAPIPPGLVIMGASGSPDALRWQYAYRMSLVAQKVMKGSVYSEVQQEFIPFIFYGVLVPRDAEILLDMKRLHFLRYPGNASPLIEFSYMVPKLLDSIQQRKSSSAKEDLDERLSHLLL